MADLKAEGAALARVVRHLEKLKKTEPKANIKRGKKPWRT